MRLLALILCLALPFAAAAQTDTTQPDGPIAVEGNATTDAAIANRIRAILGELEGYGDVTVAVSSGIVTLRGTTLDMTSAGRLSDLVGRVEGIVAIENDVRETTDLVERLNPALERFKDRAIQMIAFLPLALIALAVFVVIVLFGFWLARRRKPWDGLAPNAFIADIYRQIIRLLFVVGGLIVALEFLGATALLSGILGAAGIVGLAIGFAVRDTVENFIASIMLSIRQPFRPNDTVEIEGDIGKVIRLTSRATILLSFDGNHIRIPNATVFKSRIVNYSRNDDRRFVYALSVASDADLALARRLALETLQSLPFVLAHPEPAAWIESVDDHWITMHMAGWIDQTQTSTVLARGEAIRLTLAAFDEQNLVAPAPTYRLEGAQTAIPGSLALAKKQATSQPAPLQDTDARADKELEQIVDQERATLEDSDLLSRHAHEE